MTDSREGNDMALDSSFLREAHGLFQCGSWHWNLKTNAVWWSAGMYIIYGRSPAAGPPQAGHAGDDQ